jgi:Pyruvate/2-oxoacid:ferredoxin oxidoreductase gamma subunit
LKEMQKAIKKTIRKKREEIVKMNFDALDRGAEVIEVPVSRGMERH